MVRRGLAKPGKASYAATEQRLERLFVAVASGNRRSRAGDSQGSPARREIVFGLPDCFAERLFTALCRAHGLEAKRLHKRTRCNLVICGSQSQLDRLVADFETLQRACDDHRLALLDHLIANILNADGPRLQERFHLPIKS